MKKKRWKNFCLMIAVGLNVGLLLGDCVTSAFLSAPLSFRFKSAPSIETKSAPSSIELSCIDTSFHAEEVYYIYADVSGNGCFESAVKWSVESGSLSYFISANRFYFTSNYAGAATIKACSSMDKNISATFNVTFQQKEEEHTRITYSIPTFFYSSDSKITSYVSDSSIPYDQSLKLNLLLQNSEHDSAFVKPFFQLVSDCHSKIDEFGNVLLDSKDIEKTISGIATIDMGNSGTYTKNFSFKVLYPTNYMASTLGLHIGSFLLNSLPFAISSFCLSLFLKQKNAAVKETLLTFGCFGVGLVGFNITACLLVSGENLALTLINSSLSYLLGAVLPQIKGLFLSRESS